MLEPFFGFIHLETRSRISAGAVRNYKSVMTLLFVPGFHSFAQAFCSCMGFSLDLFGFCQCFGYHAGKL